MRATRSGLPYPGIIAQRPVPLAATSAMPSVPAVQTAPPAPTVPAPTLRHVVPLVTFGSLPFAGEGPLLIEQSSPDGSWVAVCQARQDSNGDSRVEVRANARGDLEGDAMDRLLLTPGEELPMQALLSSDAAGRFALLMQGSELFLRDMSTRRMASLSARDADSLLSAESFAPLRTVSFDSNATHLAYVRPGSAENRLVIRDLNDGSERDLAAGPDMIWRARLDPGGVFAVLEIVSEDSNKNGRLERPAPFSIGPRPCRANPGRYHAWSGDQAGNVLLPLNGGALIREPGLIMPVRDALLLRDAAGALLLARGGSKRELEPAACKGRVVHADVQRELFLFGCAQKKTGRVSLDLVTRTERRALGIELASVDLDREASDAPRLVPLYPGAESALFDADRLQLLPLGAGDVVIATRGARALIRRGRSLRLFDAETRIDQALPGELDRFPDVLVTAPFAYVSPLLVDLEHGKSVLVSEPRPLALSNVGQLLFAATPANGAALARGPLHWVQFAF